MKNKKTNFNYTLWFSLFGLILSVILFFSSSAIKYYLIKILISMFIFGSIGWTIDKFKPKKIITILLILIYISMFLLFISIKMGGGHCQAFFFWIL